MEEAGEGGATAAAVAARLGRCRALRFVLEGAPADRERALPLLDQARTSSLPGAEEREAAYRGLVALTGFRLVGISRDPSLLSEPHWSVDRLVRLMEPGTPLTHGGPGVVEDTTLLARLLLEREHHRGGRGAAAGVPGRRRPSRRTARRGTAAGPQRRPGPRGVGAPGGRGDGVGPARHRGAHRRGRAGRHQRHPGQRPRLVPGRAVRLRDGDRIEPGPRAGFEVRGVEEEPAADWAVPGGRAQSRPPPSAATADFAALMAPLLISSVVGASWVSKSLPL
ncbi:hypothetical protein [Streptomyces eurythermus]